MREAFRQLLVRGVPEVQDRVKEGFAFRAEDGLPALVVRELINPDLEDYAAGMHTIEVWCVTKATSLVKTDALAAKVKEVTDNAVFEDDGKRFYVEYLRTGTDQPDPTFGGLVRVVTLDVADLSWMRQNTFTPDPIEALQRWTKATFPQHGLQTDPATWNPGEKPGIYWRYVGSPRVLEHLAWGSWLEVRIAGHVLTPDEHDRLEWVRRIHQALALTRRYPLDDGSPLFFELLNADSSAHPIRQGQIGITARFGVLIEQEQQPIARVGVAGNAGSMEVT